MPPGLPGWNSRQKGAQESARELILVDNSVAFLDFDGFLPVNLQWSTGLRRCPWSHWIHIPWRWELRRDGADWSWMLHSCVMPRKKRGPPVPGKSRRCHWRLWSGAIVTCRVQSRTIAPRKLAASYKDAKTISYTYTRNNLHHIFNDNFSSYHSKNSQDCKFLKSPGLPQALELSPGLEYAVVASDVEDRPSKYAGNCWNMLTLWYQSQHISTELR